MLISGVTVIVAMAGMFISGDKTFISFAEGTILVVAIAMFASLTRAAGDAVAGSATGSRRAASRCSAAGAARRASRASGRRSPAA